MRIHRMIGVAVLALAATALEFRRLVLAPAPDAKGTACAAFGC